MGHSVRSYRAIIDTVAVIYFTLFSVVKGRSASLKGEGISSKLPSPTAERVIPYVADDKGNFISYDLNIANRALPYQTRHRTVHVVIDSAKYGKMLLKLHSRDKLIAPSAVLEWTNNNVTFSKAVTNGCKYYHGKVKHSHGSFISLGICDGLMGVVTIGEEELNIEPVRTVLSGASSGTKDFMTVHTLYKSESEKKDKRCPQDQVKEKTSNVWTKQWRKMHPEPEHFIRRSKRGTRQRHKRSHPRTRYLETLVVTDSSLVEFHGKERVEQYLMTQMNIVDLVYHHATLGGIVKVVVTKILFMDHSTAKSILVERDARVTLDNFCGWMNDRGRQGFDELGHHDMAVYITRENLGPAGYAPVTGMCNPTRSCSVTRDDGLSSAFVIAHEIAHIFGVHHDGYNNNCTDDPETGALMTTTVRSTFDRYYWSECSRAKFLEHISSLHCLDDTPTKAGHDSKVDVKTPLGLNWGLDDQCRQEFGEEFVLCRAFTNLDPCNYLWCSTEADPYMCKTKRIEPLPGTPCDFGKWCMNRKCTYITAASQDGGWSSWESWGACSRTCGGGVRFRYRKCNNPVPTADGRECPGEPYEEQLCNKQDCPGPYRDARAEQCSQLNGANFHRGRRHTWLPIENEENSQLCKLTCISAQTNDVIVKNDVIDGTFCSYEMPDNICIKGQCRTVGCDGVINSNKEEDMCGVCEGDNTSCRKVIGNFRKAFPRGVYQQLVAIPRGARHIEVSNRETSRNFIAMRQKRSAVYVLNGRYTQSHSKQLVVDGSRFVYSNKDGTEFLSARGPLREDMEVMIYQADEGVKNEISYSYIAPLDVLSTLSNQVDAMPTQFYWTRRGWSGCSKTCGPGLQHEQIDCIDVETDLPVTSDLCGVDAKPKPAKRACEKAPCQVATYSWKTKDWHSCTHSCGEWGTRQRYVECINNVHGREYSVSHEYCPANKKPTTTERCNTQPCPAYWQTGRWSKCSVSCGVGKQTRTVTCNKPRDGNTYKCDGEEPAKTKSCQMPKCEFYYSWKTEDWGPCSRPCGKYGSKQRRVFCSRLFNGKETEVEDRFCDAQSRPSLSGKCNSQPCLASWNYGKWSKCSVTCGKGVQRREVSCDKPDDDLYECEGQKPQETRECEMQVCKEQIVMYEWSSDQWSGCTATCGNGGIRQRHVKCVRRYNHIKDTIDNRYCDQRLMPTHTEPCNKQPCPLQWTTGQWSQCSVTCGTGEQTRKVVCDKPRDGSTYKCIDRKPESTRPCVNAPCQESFKWKRQAWSQCSATCGKRGIQQRHIACAGQVNGREMTVDPRYCAHVEPPPYTRSCKQKPCPATWTTGSWTRCSVSCGEGVQTRSVTCRRPRDGDIYKCFDAKPSSSRKCSLRECPASVSFSWHSDEWGSCSHTCGHFSIRQRKVVCVRSQNGVHTAMDSRYCDYRLRPKKTEICKSKPCPAQWRTGPWSKCSATCGSGMQTRRVTCPNNSKCEEPQPPDTKLCEVKPCPVMTRGRLSQSDRACRGDKSVFCHLASSSPSLCRNKTYRNRCCVTCQHYLPL